METEKLSSEDQFVVEDRRGYQSWTNNLPESKFKRVIAKLFSNEDKLQIHKTLGFLSVLSFVYRYFWVYPTTGTLGFNGSYFDIASIALHLLLSTSSLIFHVLSARILSRPMIIWEEYRLHAIVFSTRCLTVFLLGYFQPFHNTPYERLLQGALVLLHHVAADEVTKRYGAKDQSSTTVRVKDNYNSFHTFILRFYAFYQFSALASHLLPNPRLCDIGFNALIAIQSSAFLMTLYRKGLISYQTHGIWYTACLVISMWHIFANCANVLFIVKLFTAFFFRVRFGVNKYVLWVLFVLLSFPEVEAIIKTYYQSVVHRNLDDDYVSITGGMIAQSLFFFGIKSDL